MSRTIFLTITLVVGNWLCSSAVGGELHLRGICGNDVPDCVCKWCCPDYCRKPLPCVCGPLPPNLSCGPKCYSHYWCRKRNPAHTKTHKPMCDCAIETEQVSQPESVQKAHLQAADANCAEGVPIQARLEVASGETSPESGK